MRGEGRGRVGGPGWFDRLRLRLVCENCSRVGIVFFRSMILTRLSALVHVFRVRFLGSGYPLVLVSSASSPSISIPKSCVLHLPLPSPLGLSVPPTPFPFSVSLHRLWSSSFTSSLPFTLMPPHSRFRLFYCSRLALGESDLIDSATSTTMSGRIGGNFLGYSCINVLR